MSWRTEPPPPTQTPHLPPPTRPPPLPANHATHTHTLAHPHSRPRTCSTGLARTHRGGAGAEDEGERGVEEDEDARLLREIYDELAGVSPDEIKAMLEEKWVLGVQGQGLEGWGA
jgi:hypothetical protein